MNAKSLSVSEIAAMGGKARAAKLTSEQKSEQGRRAVEARWGKDLPQATHGSPDRPLRIANVEIPCYVLADGRRVIVQSGMFTALDISQGTANRGQGDRLTKFISGKAISLYVPDRLRSMIIDPIRFTTTAGGLAYGYEGTVLADLCDAVLEARKMGKLNYQTEHVAAQCELLVRGFARVGIIALIDEATGFQYDRPRRDLEEYLKKFLSESLVRWARTFPNDYFKHLCRLKGVDLRPDMRLPQYFGHVTNDLVYRRIAPGLLRALKERRTERGRPSNKLHWWTSDELGHPALLLHLGTVVGLMKIHTNYDDFYAQLDTIAPVYPEVPGLFDDPADWQTVEDSVVSK
jgi:hypothetical protein